MSIGPLGILSSVSAAPSQASGAESAKHRGEAAVQARHSQSTQKTEDAAGVGKTDEEEHSANARALSKLNDSLLAPDLLVAEVGSVFLKKIRAGLMTIDAFVEALDAIDRYLQLAPTSRAFYPALALASDHNRSFYDSLYVALALHEGCRFVTADLKLYNGLKHALPETMLWIGDVPPVASEAR